MAMASNHSSRADSPRLRRIISYREVCDAIGKTRATVARLVKRDPRFPKPLRVGTFSTGFYEDEVAEYLNGLLPAVDAPVHHKGQVHLHRKDRRSA
ncbi:AlpA family phage regulatory protein [Bradyrhizobium sp. 76]|uniref:helix-turn-helix transcriptional regulator n=1 Tax=Bradyrhizobium sp. 76 TaxID=2782680 RepID=UPI001FF70D33|nr:AlpA family phage regulatory protein [Bradyrhizobium sp. 76]MCK1409540.1 AlpA family phage regulatory protein [Bradyrhizobium sp. 76]